MTEPVVLLTPEQIKMKKDRQMKIGIGIAVVLLIAAAVGAYLYYRKTKDACTKDADCPCPSKCTANKCASTDLWVKETGKEYNNDPSKPAVAKPDIWGTIEECKAQCKGDPNCWAFGSGEKNAAGKEHCWFKSGKTTFETRAATFQTYSKLCK